MNIHIEHNPSEERLSALEVLRWPIWQKDISTFPWTYDDSETCYLLEGDVIIAPDDGAAVRIKKGDLVTFPAGLSCTWEILQPVRKHYAFGDISA